MTSAQRCFRRIAKFLRSILSGGSEFSHDLSSALTDSAKNALNDVLVQWNITRESVKSAISKEEYRPSVGSTKYFDEQLEQSFHHAIRELEERLDLSELEAQEECLQFEVKQSIRDWLIEALKSGQKPILIPDSVIEMSVDYAIEECLSSA